MILIGFFKPFEGEILFSEAGVNRASLASVARTCLVGPRLFDWGTVAVHIESQNWPPGDIRWFDHWGDLREAARAVRAMRATKFPEETEAAMKPPKRLRMVAIFALLLVEVASLGATDAFATASVSPTSISFGDQPVGVGSAPISFAELQHPCLRTEEDTRCPTPR